MSLRVLVASTAKLPNGHQFTPDDLHQIAEDWSIGILNGRPFLLFDNHRPGRAPWARMLGLTVVPHRSEAGLLTLEAEIEPLPEVSEEEVKERLSRGGMSMAFLGRIYATLEEPVALTIGLSPEMAKTDQELEEVLDSLRAELPDIGLRVGRYHQHAAAPPPTLLIVVATWFGLKIADKLFELLWQAVFPPHASRPLPEQVQIEIRRDHGTAVTVEVPFSGDHEKMRVALAEGLREAARLDKGGERSLRVSLDFDQSGAVTRYETLLPPGPSPAGVEQNPPSEEIRDEGNSAPSTALSRWVQEGLQRIRRKSNEVLKVAEEMTAAADRALFAADMFAFGAIKRHLSTSAAFCQLIEAGNLVSARTLLKIEMDTVLGFSAVWLVKDVHAFVAQVLHGVTIDQLPDREGQSLTINRLMSPHLREHPWVPEVYENLSKFTQLSGAHMAAPFRPADDGSYSIELSETDRNVLETTWIEIEECFIELTDMLLADLQRWITVKRTLPRKKNET